MRDDGCRGGEVRIDPVEHRRASLVVGCTVEVVAAEAIRVVGEVAEEVDVLEGRTEASRPVDEVGRGASRRRHARVQEHLQAHEPHDLGRPVHVGVVGQVVVRGGVDVGAHRSEERGDQIAADAAFARRAGEGVHDEVGAEAGVDGIHHLRLEGVEHRALLLGGEPGVVRGTVDDLIGHAHQCVDVAHVGTGTRAEQPRGHAERGRVAGDDRGGGVVGRLRVECESRVGRGHGTRSATVSTSSSSMAEHAGGRVAPSTIMVASSSVS